MVHSVATGCLLSLALVINYLSLVLLGLESALLTLAHLQLGVVVGLRLQTTGWQVMS